MTRWEDVARAGAGDDYARVYADRFRRLAESGRDTHGEATFVDEAWPTASVLDAGCGTGRIGARLAELGHPVVGCDVDASMVAVAREEVPDVAWHVADLATLSLGARFDVVLLAGNVVPLLEDDTLTPVCAALAAHCAPRGVVVCGFGLDSAHLPAGCPVTPLPTFLAAAAGAGLVERERWSGWAREPWSAADGYVVCVLGLVE